MDKSKFQMYYENMEDDRFGKVDILCSGVDPKTYVLSKKLILDDQEEFDRLVNRLRVRKSVACSNLLAFRDFELNSQELSVTIFYEIPFTDLDLGIPELHNPIELYNILTQIISAMAALEEKCLVHGDIRPEFILFDSEKKQYILLDNIRDFSLPLIVQKHNLEVHDHLYLPPAIFNELAQGKIEIPHNPYKLEMFSFGLTLLSMFAEPKEIQAIYLNPNGAFDKSKFQQIIDKVSQEHFQNHLMRILGDFIVYNMLATAPSDRLSAKKALSLLQDKLSKDMLSQRDMPKPVYEPVIIEPEIEKPVVAFAAPPEEPPINHKVIVAEVVNIPTPPNPNYQDPTREIEKRKPIKFVSVLPIQKAEDPKLDLKAYQEIYFKNADLSYKHGEKVVNPSPLPKRENIHYNLITSDEDIDRRGVTFKRAPTPETIKKEMYSPNVIVNNSNYPRFQFNEMDSAQFKTNTIGPQSSPNQYLLNYQSNISPGQTQLVPSPHIVKNSYISNNSKDPKYSANSVNSNSKYPVTSGTEVNKSVISNNNQVYPGLVPDATIKPQQVYYTTNPNINGQRYVK